MLISTRLAENFSVGTLLDKVPVIDIDPPYQREGNVWSNDQKARLIDTVINGLDMPKLYFQQLSGDRTDPATGFTIQFAVLDGKQRIEALTDFVQGSLTLPDDFIFFEDESKDAAGMSFKELQAKYPELANRILDYRLPIVYIQGHSGDLIEEMFQRLNTATSLNAAEKRNAISGAARDASNFLSEHEFFRSKVAIRNARYKYRELSTKFLVCEKQIRDHNQIKDTKAKTLYKFFVDSHQGVVSDQEIRGLQRIVSENLERMNTIFLDTDRLLRSVGTLVVYYLAFRDEEFSGLVDRDTLVEFEELRRNLDEDLELDPKWVELLRRYNTFVQSTNDGSALQFRVDVLKFFVRWKGDPQAAAMLDDLWDRDVLEEEGVE